MTAISTCPDEHELLPLATGEPAEAAVERHLSTCPACRGRVERLRAEVSELRRELGGAPAADPSTPDPAAEGQGKPADGWPHRSLPGRARIHPFWMTSS